MHVGLVLVLRMVYVFVQPLRLQNKFSDLLNSFTKFRDYIVSLNVRKMNNLMERNVFVLRVSIEL